MRITWFIANKLKKLDQIRYAIFAAKQVLYIFEKKYPGDTRPRLAIQAAEKYLKNPNKKAADAAYAAANAAADAADVAAYVAAAVAYAAADAANDAKLKLKIINYGIKLLGVKL